MHFSSYITDMEGMEENSNSDYVDEMLEYDAVVEDDCDISSDIADTEESLTDEEDHSATDSNPYVRQTIARVLRNMQFPNTAFG